MQHRTVDPWSRDDPFSIRSAASAELDPCPVCAPSQHESSQTYDCRSPCVTRPPRYRSGCVRLWRNVAICCQRHTHKPGTPSSRRRGGSTSCSTQKLQVARGPDLATFRCEQKVNNSEDPQDIRIRSRLAVAHLMVRRFRCIWPGTFPATTSRPTSTATYCSSEPTVLNQVTPLYGRVDYCWNVLLYMSV
jgi:hypothetical protein